MIADMALVNKIKTFPVEYQVKAALKCLEDAGNKRKLVMAILLLKNAANEQNIDAIEVLASLYFHGVDLNMEHDEFVNLLKTAADAGSLHAKFYLATIYKQALGAEQNYEKAIKYYIQCLDDTTTEDNVSIQTSACCNLVQCFVQLYHIEEANATRDFIYYKSTNKNKDSAKQYLALAPTYISQLPESERPAYESKLKIYSSILNDKTDDISAMNYGDFRKAYYDKFPRIFLTTKKSEDSIYRDGIKNYFRKRDESAEELALELAYKQKQIEKRKAMIKKAVPNLNISTDPEVIYAKLISELESELQKEQNEFLNKYVIDYSNCVINLDKYLEEIIHQLFVVDVHEYKKELAQAKVDNKLININTQIDALSPAELKQIVELTNDISASIPDEKIPYERRKQILQTFAQNVATGKNKKSIKTKVDIIEQYLHTEASKAITVTHDDGTLSEEEKENTLSLMQRSIIKNTPSLNLLNDILNLHTVQQELDSLKINTDFQLGALFNLTFVENLIDEEGNKIKTTNKLKQEIIDFVARLNPSMKESDISLKVSELILKVEHFRVMVRNVASHKSILTQQLLEKGLSLCITEENSIFSLLDELFGDHLEQKFYLQDAEKLLNVDIGDEKITYNDIELAMGSILTSEEDSKTI